MEERTTRRRSPVRTLTLVFGVLAVLLASCTSGNDKLASATPRPPSADQPPPLVPVVIGAADRRTDSFVLNSAAVSSHVLTLSVSYSGGCRNHEFVLTAAAAFVEADPYQLDLVLTHDANGDRCEAFPTEQLRYDLTPIRERYRGAYGRDSGTVHLHLDQSPAPLVYRF